MNMRRLVLPIAFALGVMLAGPLSAAEKVSSHDLFQLWNNCGPINMLVANLSADADKIGLRKEDIETTVRSRLRAARIYLVIPEPYLVAHVSVVGHAFSVDVEFKRTVRVPFRKAPPKVLLNNLTVFQTSVPLEYLVPLGHAATWEIGVTGTHGNSPEYILSSVAKFTDRFIDEYLRVNAVACQ